MSVFGSYSRYYDLLYTDKDYAREAEFVDGVIRRYAPAAETLLDLGCGTGLHAACFAQQGYHVTGVDISAEMLDKARERQPPNGTKGAIEFRQGDIRSFDLQRRFDVVVALFHVISYLPTNADLESAFARISEHLKPGGLIIFDHWYGPAVLIDRPTPRIKLFEDSDVKITRVATPTLHVNDNLVDVRYDLMIVDKATHRLDQFTENHRMRYLFWPEIESLLSRQELRPIKFSKWLDDRVPDQAL